MKFLMATLLAIFLCNSSYAQLEKIVHQTFEVGENQSISLDLVGEVSVVPWAGNNVMVETHIQLYDASPSILRHFLEKEKRYSIEMTSTNSELTLFSFDKERKDIRTKQGVCTEIVKVKVFIPEEFEKQNDSTLVKTD